MKLARVYPESNRRGFAQIIIVAIILLLVGVGFFIFWRVKIVPRHSLNDVVISPPSGQQLIEAETANWKTFTNTTIGYSVKYPPEWSALEKTCGDFFSNGAGSLYKADLCASGARATLVVSPSVSLEKKLVGDEVTFSKSPVLGSDGHIINYDVRKKDKSFIFQYTKFNGEEDISKTIETIIKTLVFTSDETANWKTYTNTKRQYTFKYPASYQLSDSNLDSISIALDGKDNKITFYSGQVEIAQPDHYKCDKGENFNLDRYKTLYTKCLTAIDSVGTVEVGGNNGVSYDKVPVVILYSFNSGSNEQVFNQILSTFKFIN